VVEDPVEGGERDRACGFEVEFCGFGFDLSEYTGAEDHGTDGSRQQRAHRQCQFPELAEQRRGSVIAAMPEHTFDRAIQ